MFGRLSKWAKEYCELCGSSNLDPPHHIFNGAYKKKSEKYNYMIQLCADCHRKVHREIEERKKLKAKCQVEYEQTKTREEFIREFGKSYL